ncbi:histidine kinase [Marivirga sp. S37H4]|uniref:Histidine kinase n=1 Tax=Marivirga aurantiaca TaxID=2802615 RepID=A0A934X208_9BACT|nr:histidine kinase [Marivirga aurantiaca]MBK6266992.1 histidine kinase [Marivirga aurantiaca]
MINNSALSKICSIKTLKDFLFLNLGIAFLLMLFYCPTCFLSLEGIRNILPDFIFSFLMSSALSMGGYAVEAYFDNKISWIEFPVKRLFLTVVIYLLYSFIVSYTLSVMYGLLTSDTLTLQNISWTRMLENTVVPIVIALVIISIFTARSWLYEWRNAAIETEQLRSEKLAGQYQSLKDQLNPHFLFNSLNVLSSLVYENADKSAAFIQQLSRIYRYVLDMQFEELVSVEEELNFAKNYLSLQKIRFEESLIFHIKIENNKDLYLPPLSLQLLLENAIKHNIASMEHPLTINIEEKDGKLIVRNNYQPKITKDSENRGIGLENIKKRYALLSKKTPLVIEMEKEFLVELPLLSLNK